MAEKLYAGTKYKCKQIIYQKAKATQSVPTF